MTGRHIYHSDGTETFFLDGKQVAKEEYDTAMPDRPIGNGQGLIGWHKPVESDALAVHPEQIPEAMERDKKHGINVEYKPDGRPIFTSESQMRQMMKSMGLHRNNCYM